MDSLAQVEALIFVEDVSGDIVPEGLLLEWSYLDDLLAFAVARRGDDLLLYIERAARQ